LLWAAYLTFIEGLETAKGRKDVIQHLLITAVGPFASFVLAALFFGLFFLLHNKEATPFTTPLFLVLQYLVYVNIALGIFNLIPVFPLDGGQIMMNAIRLAGAGEQKAQAVASIIAVIVAGVMMTIGAISAFNRGPMEPVSGAWIFTIAMFLFAINLAILAILLRPLSR